MNTVETLILVLISYLLGALPFGYLVAKAIRGVDITAHGSGNIGATNVWRVLGPLPGTLVLAADVGKGALAVWLGRVYGAPEVELLTGAAAVIGHGWSVFLGFRGGKMIATSGGVLLMLSPLATLGGFIVWAVTLAVSRYVSLASIITAVSIPLWFYYLGFSRDYLIFTSILAAAAIYKHRSNIKRLIHGNEYKFGARR
ncbi:MAG: glycerol-3-phosphate 1-O-acyltransferase PlsY [Bacillota bacterium]|uniref:glycerol-3-phosphate 1-O-acyltransferase PlsY n=1 Tax=Desulforudis sp. DRI-14 TaxID=3459793 RepID=UPI003498ADD2